MHQVYGKLNTKYFGVSLAGGFCFTLNHSVPLGWYWIREHCCGKLEHLWKKSMLSAVIDGSLPPQRRIGLKAVKSKFSYLMFISTPNGEQFSGLIHAYPSPFNPWPDCIIHLLLIALFMMAGLV